MHIKLNISRINLIHFVLISLIASYSANAHAITFDNFDYFTNLPGDRDRRVDNIIAAESYRSLSNAGTGEVLNTVTRHRTSYYRNPTITQASLDALEASGNIGRNTVVSKLTQSNETGINFKYDYTTGSSFTLIYDNGIYTPGNAPIGQRSPDFTGSIDFTKFDLDVTLGGATALEVDLLFDFSEQTPLNVDFTLYDRNDPTGNTFSSGTLQIAEAVFTDPRRFSLNFSALNSFGSNGAADLTQIGAMILTFNTSSMRNFDLSIFRYGTNGNTEIPEPGSLVLLGASSLYFARKRKSA
jgi:hypothetical protein